MNVCHLFITFLSPDPIISQLKWVVVGIVVLMLCVCVIVVIGYILYHYLMGIGQETPYTLVIQTTCTHALALNSP